MAGRKIIIDTDPGIDDFFCIFLAAGSGAFDIRAITAVAGNRDIDTCTQNALNIAQFLNIKTRVARGSGSALMHDMHITEAAIHGENGLGGAVLPTASQKEDKLPAWDVIYQEAVAAKGELELVPVGPLTNIAIAILKYPDLKNYIKSITLMGGSYDQGIITPYSEPNSWHDPFAAAVVYQSGIPISQCGFSVTRHLSISTELFYELAALCRPPVERAIREMAKWRSGEPVHDCVAVAAMLNPGILKAKDYFVEVVTTPGINYGTTVVDWNGVRGKAPNATIMLSVDKQGYLDTLRQAFKYFS